jgi:hypothetical protein
MRMRIVKRVGQEDGRQGGWGRWFAKRWGFMSMVGKGLGKGGWQKGGVYEDGWQGAWGQWLAKGRGFMRMLGKGLGEGGLQKGGGL